MTLRDGVVITYEGVRITGEEIRLKSSPAGIEIEGRARVSLCPCEPSPIAVRLLGARVEPSGDLVARWPQFELFGIPLLTLPWLWIRPFNRAGLTPPILAWRGEDGLLAGAGVHLPFAGTGGMRSLDVTAAGYFRGGAELTARLHTPQSTARVVWDHLQSSRLVVDAHGSAGGGDALPRLASVAWDMDFVRGPRGRSATVDLGPAAQPFDFGHAQSSLGFVAPNGASGRAATGIVARAFRGEGAMVAGPEAAVSFSGPISAKGSWDGEVSGVFLGRPFVRAALGLALDLCPGPAEIQVSARGRARAAGASTQPAGQDAVAGVAAELRLPLVRAYGEGVDNPPLLHWLVPTLEARGAIAATGGSHWLTLSRRLAPLSWLGAAGLSSALGKPLGSAFGMVVRMGLLGEHGAPSTQTLAMAHARASAHNDWISTRVEAAAVASPTGRAIMNPPAGMATTAELRVGPMLGPSVLVDMAAAHGSEAQAARLLTFGSAALPGEELRYSRQPGWTGGAELKVPWTSELTASIRADADLTAASLLALGAGLAYRDHSGCLTLGISGAGRLGREGMDVWLSAAITPPSRSLR